MYIKMTSIWINTPQSSTTNTYYLIKVTKFPSSSKMMSLNRINWIQGKRKTNAVLMISIVVKKVTHNQNLIMIKTSLRLSILLLTQEVMVQEY